MNLTRISTSPVAPASGFASQAAPIGSNAPPPTINAVPQEAFRAPVAGSRRSCPRVPAQFGPPVAYQDDTDGAREAALAAFAPKVLRHHDTGGNGQGDSGRRDAQSAQRRLATLRLQTGIDQVAALCKASDPRAVEAAVTLIRRVFDDMACGLLSRAVVLHSAHLVRKHLEETSLQLPQTLDCLRELLARTTPLPGTNTPSANDLGVLLAPLLLHMNRRSAELWLAQEPRQRAETLPRLGRIVA